MSTDTSELDDLIEYDEDEDLYDEGYDAVDAHLTDMFRFLAHVEDQRRTAPDGCWTWPGAITPATGYGRVNVGARQIDTHRYSWELFRGPVPSDREVCHHCDNRACINPAHLFLGTRSDNMRDARNKGRIAGQKLQHGDIPHIRAAIVAGESRTSIAARYGVSPRTIDSIKAGRSWADVP